MSCVRMPSDDGLISSTDAAAWTDDSESAEAVKK
jgi:hypothetical protein